MSCRVLKDAASREVSAAQLKFEKLFSEVCRMRNRFTQKDRSEKQVVRRPVKKTDVDPAIVREIKSVDQRNFRDRF